MGMGGEPIRAGWVFQTVSAASGVFRCRCRR